ncbi:MAG: thiolase family protein [Bdellovibrionaceae bacterium]|jgi:acetyl-CoA C-acetyltransferase|nr:thiolase family protein [Pseudobdellovibrionaceae bacterium]
MSKSTYILSAKRTPMGSFMGSLSSLAAPQLGATVIKSAMETANVPFDKVDECIMGQVLTAGAGQAPARQAAIYAGLEKSTTCMTINKVCGSGLKAVMLASDSIQLGHSQVVVAGGQENMSLAPHLLLGSRTGQKMGPLKTVDSMVNDGLWDPYNNFHMGNAAEACVKEYQFSREEQDAFAIESYKKAQTAQKNNAFSDEITTVEIKTRKGSTEVNSDEEPQKVNFDKIPQLRPAFDKEGAITAANASSINDGAAALVLASEDAVATYNAKPIAKIITHATFAQDPIWFTTAPVEAMKRALKKADLKVEDIDLWEINEAFSVVTMAAIKDLEIDASKVNVHGGAVSLGHPIGASGARIFTTLIHALKQQNKKYGMASLCIGGGEAVAVIVENL